MSDPFDELRGEVLNNLTLLQEQLSRAKQSTNTSSSSSASAVAALAPSKQIVDEILVSLQAIREDADLLRSACRTLRRRHGNPSAEEAPPELLRREAFCEKTDDELDRVQTVVEGWQRRNFVSSSSSSSAPNLATTSTTSSAAVAVAKGSRNNNNNHRNNNNHASSAPAFSANSGVAVVVVPETSTASDAPVPSPPPPPPPSAAAVAQMFSNNSHHQHANDDDDDDGDNIPLNKKAITTGPSPLPQHLQDPNNNSVMMGIDNRSWDRDAALKRLRQRQQKRRSGDSAEEDGGSIATTCWNCILERATQCKNGFQDWAVDFFDKLEWKHKMTIIGALAFVCILMVVALFVHRK